MSFPKLDHVYVCVEDLDRAIAFYEQLLGEKIKNRSETRWADFAEAGVYLGLYRPGFDQITHRIGNNVMITLRTEDIHAEFERIRAFAPKISSGVARIGDTYLCFHFEDTEGNPIEIAQYPR